MIDEILLSRIGVALSDELKVKILINQTEKIHGGDINETYRIQTNEGPYFLKLNDAIRFPDMFSAEYAGLTALKDTQTLTIPQPVCYGTAGNQAFLVTTFIEKGSAIRNFWEDFGVSLARLHQHSQPHFGFDGPNYLGSLRQYNTPYSSWPVFYAFNRLLPLTRMAYDQQIIEKTMVQQMEKLCRQLPEIFSQEPPALLHGDLWSGNFMVGKQGSVCLYDPAVYYGHREMDLAMTRLFGGFDTKFYYAYHAAYPLAEGWQQRIGICQLYPLLVHMLLFGGSYYSSIREILQQH
jgi:fructosamine-3-kinase